MRARQKHDRRYWSVKPPEWKSLLDKPLIEACSLQWKYTVEHTLKYAQKLPQDRYIQIHYEDMVKRPFETFNSVAEKCGLQWKHAQLNSIVEGLENRNYKWSELLTPNEIKTLNSLLGSLLSELGYQV